MQLHKQTIVFLSLSTTIPLKINFLIAHTPNTELLTQPNNHNHHNNINLYPAMGKVEQEIDKLLDQYLDGRLSTDEVRLLHRQLEAGKNTENSNLAELDEWIDRIALPDDLFRYSPATLTEVATKKQTTPTETIIPVVSIRQVLVWGLLFIFTLSLSLYWYILPFERNEALFDKYFQPIPLSEVTFVDEGQKEKDLWNLIVFKYNERKFDIAAKDLEKLSAQISQNNEAPNKLNIDALNLLTGIAHLAAYNTKAALPYLNTVAATESSWQQQANWFAALAYLQNSDLARARFCLERIIQNPKAYNHNTAQTLFHEIKHN